VIAVRFLPCAERLLLSGARAALDLALRAGEADARISTAGADHFSLSGRALTEIDRHAA
jgi:hypothetical protein